VARSAAVDDSDLAHGHLCGTGYATRYFDDVVGIGGHVALEHVLAKSLRVVIEHDETAFRYV